MRRATYTLAITAACLLSSVPATLARAPLPAAMPTITHAACPDDASAAGCTYQGSAPCGNPAGCVYVRLDSWFALAHELGHVFDYQSLTDNDRLYLQRLLGYADDIDWHVGSRLEAPPAEAFADTYAKCSLEIGPARSHHHARRAFNRFCGTVRFIAARNASASSVAG